MCPLYLLRYLRLPLFFSLLWPLLVSGKDAPPLQLANIYHSSIQIQDYWISEKYDGVRAYWDGKQFISKQGKPYHAPYWFIKNFPDVPLDGELWLARAQFDKLSGIVRKHVPIDAEWQTVSYQVFDLPKSDYTFDVRVEQLEALVKQQTIPAWLQLIPQFKLKNEAELWQTLERINAKKGEGLMLHKGSSFYHAGRDDELLKLKKYQDAEARVIQHLSGKGKHQHRLGALLVEAVNHSQKGRRFKVGTGFSDQERLQPPAIGSIIRYKYFGLTSKGLPRFASFMHIREYDEKSIN